MPAVDSKKPQSLGFLTVLEHPQHGLMGGYLVLNTAGRPLEFHCTAAIKPNRAQEILYGPTLEPYLFGEQIGQALVAKSTSEPLVICTDVRPAMAVRPLISPPVALVLKERETEATDNPLSSLSATNDAGDLASDVRSQIDRLRTPHLRLDRALADGPPLQIFQIGRNRLAVTPDRESDRSEVLKRLAPLDELFDLSEPFGRIREALDEAQRR
ncbi:MAG TPA: hypothetical protein VKB78_03775 [Pirellulales bacterium]|nr:hypothetical protein [Pirellulales bacterium]